MTPQELLQEGIEEFDKYKLEEYGKWKIGRAEAKHFLTTHTIKLLQAEIERLEGMKKRIALIVMSFDGITKKGTITEKGYETLSKEMEARGYNQALQDQISHLQEQIIKIRENI